MNQRRLEIIFLPLALGLLFIAGWHFAVIGSHTKVFPSPLAVYRGFAELSRRGVLFPYIGASLLRVGAGYGLALMTGIPAGILLGSVGWASRAFGPLIQFLRPISPIAWIPVAIVLFGIGTTSTVFLIYIASFFPIVLASMNGVGAVPKMYTDAGRNFGLSKGKLLLRVVFPAALPSILIGLRLALGIAWLVVVAAEMIAVDSGLGYLIIDARNAGKRYDLVVAGMLLIGVIGLGLNILIRRVETLRPVQWGFRAE